MQSAERMRLVERPARSTRQVATGDRQTGRGRPPLHIQARLRVGAANDPLEREADAVMRRVVDALAARETAPRVEPALPVESTAEPGRVRRFPADATPAPLPITPVAGPITRIRRSSTAEPGAIGAGGGGLDAETDSMVRSRIGRGHKLQASVRRTMESQFGHDFGNVRVHDDAASKELNNRMSAEAFTVNRDIFFSGPAPDLSSQTSQGLLAHELTHVVQQGGAVRRRMVSGDPDDLKRMTDLGGNPKADPPGGRSNVPAEAYENDEEEEEGEEPGEAPETVERKFIREKVKEMNVRVGEYRRAHDRMHAKKKAKAARRSSRIRKAKGVIGTTASNAGRAAGRAANEGKHGVLNVGRSIGRLVGMNVKPNTTIRKQTGANTTDTAQGAYGAVDTEYIEPKFKVKLENGQWQPILTHLKGTYGKITSPLPAGLAEIAGPDANESKQQIKDLLNLDGQDWYMVKAVDAHETIHESHLHDALNNVGTDIANMFAGLTVDQNAAADAGAAKTAIEQLPGYDAIMNLADPNDSDVRQTWDDEYVNLIDRDHYGPTQNAEADAVEPMINKINNWRKKKKMKKVKKRWTCTDDGGAVYVPKGRKNP